MIKKTNGATNWTLVLGVMTIVLSLVCTFSAVSYHYGYNVGYTQAKIEDSKP